MNDLFDAYSKLSPADLLRLPSVADLVRCQLDKPH